MSHVVRRVDQTPESYENSDLKPVLTHNGDGLSVESQLFVGAQPELHLTWSIDRQYLRDGFTLLVFHSTTAFCSDLDPDELSKHGSLIIETKENGSRSLFPDEGMQYFTFVLRKKAGLWGCSENRSEPLRFSEMVPSAKVTLGRVKDRLELRDQEHRMKVQPKHHEVERHEIEIALIESRRRLDEIRNPRSPSADEQRPPIKKHGSVLETELQWIERLLETTLACETADKAIEHDPRFKQLSPKRKKSVLKQIKERLDVAEIRARQERNRD